MKMYKRLLLTYLDKYKRLDTQILEKELKISEQQIVDMVKNIFKEIDYCAEVADALASLTCYKGVLPQGAPTSPYLANLVLRDMDKKLMELCGKEEITYTRYADDMSFSSNKDIMVYWDALKRIVEQFHFRINENKTVYYQEPHRKIVTGLIVQEDRISIPKAYKRRLRQEIYYCRKYGVLQHLENTGNEERTAFKEYLYGKAYYIHMAEPETGQKFLAELDKIEWGY